VVGHTTKVAFMLLCCVKTIKDVFIAFQKGLAALYNNNEIEAITLLTINEIVALSKAVIKAFPEREIAAGQLVQLKNILVQLQTGKPIQYILEHTEFYGLKFLVNSSVLIPRPETEELVDWIISSAANKEYHILDIGTGSGCIAISLKKNLPNAQVSALDISTGALQTAKENARLHNIDINFIQADILTIKSEVENPKYGIIVSNPPYVTLTDKMQMHVNVIDFEPHTALFVPENEPLLFYKAIADYAGKNLADNGLLFLEINETYGPETVALLAEKGFKDIELKKDMSDKSRMIKAVFSRVCINP
jgi:release factor glutamine methyltransferase